MTYFNNIMQSQQPGFAGATGQAGAMFQPGFAGTNAQEVQYQNQTGFSSASATPTYGMSFGGGIGGAQSMFQPGFAGTNVQEVRQLNSGFSSPQQFGYQQASQNNLYGQTSGYIQQQPSYQQSIGAGSIFSPGFAGTNIQEVQARNNASFAGQSSFPGFSNNAGYAAQASGGIFSPGFAGTNVQEVRQLNQGGFGSTASMNAGFGMQSQQPYASQIGSGAQSVFTPGFAGTNVQEVRSLNSGQQAPFVGSMFPGSF